MEQGGSSSNASNQRRMNFTDELTAIVMNSSQDFPVERDSRFSIPEAREYRQFGAPSFSRAPLQGEMSTQFHGGNEDFPAAYLHGNLQPREQFFHTTNALMVAGEGEPDNSYYDDQTMNRYSLSNFSADQYHMLTPASASASASTSASASASASGNRGLQIGSSQTLVPFEPSLAADAYNAFWAAQAQNNAIVPANPIPQRLVRSQGIRYQMNTPNGIHLGGNSSTTSALMGPFENSMMADPSSFQYFQAQALESSFPRSSQVIAPTPLSLPLALPLALPSCELDSGNSIGARGPSTSAAAVKRKMPSQDDPTPSSQGWNSSGRGFQRYNPSSNNNDARFTLYDRRYEEMGLPVDPHLRIFLATTGKGNGELPARRND